MIGSLRFAGVLIISVWLGAVAFFLAGAGTAPYSAEMERLLGAKNYPYYSGAIAQMLGARLFYVGLACSAAAAVHVMAAWLYLGRTPRKAWLGLLGGLVLANLVSGTVLQPKLKQLHLTAHAINVPAPARARAAQSFRAWQKAERTVDLAVLAGLIVYLWRVANPPDQTRFVSAVKFRG